MDVFIAIATYLISRRITSSASMAKWFLPMAEHFTKSKKNFLTDGTFHEYVRMLYEKSKLTSELTQYLLQVTLWLDEANTLVDVLQKNRIVIVTPLDAKYPRELLQIPDKPAILYCAGELGLFQERDKVTMVGTREPSQWGQ